MERGGQQLIQFVLGVVLARILSVDEFGLIGMLMIFIAVSRVVVDSGFSSALIWKQKTSKLEECSVFFCNLAISGTMALGLCLASPWIARFYEIPELGPLLCVLSISLVFHGLGAVHATLFSKALNFRPIMMATIPSVLISGTVGILLAANGFGVWSLAIQYVVETMVRMIMLWMLSPWRPQFLFSFRALRPLFNYGSKLFASALIEAFFQELYAMMIGKFYSPASLGFFTRARSLFRLPVSNIASIASRVAFPLFSKLWGQRDEVKRTYLQVLVLVSFVICPVMFGMAAVAEPLIHVLLTEKWLPCAPLLKIFCVVGLCYPFSAVAVGVLKASGRSDLFLRLEIIKKGVSLAVLLTTVFYGVTAIVIGQAACAVFGMLLNWFVVSRIASVPLTSQGGAILPAMGIAGLMFFAVDAVGKIEFWSEGWQLAAMIASGVIVYGLLVACIRPSLLGELRTRITNRRSSSSDKLGRIEGET